MKDLDFVDDNDITKQPLQKSVKKTSKTSKTSKKVAKKVHDDISSSNKQTKRCGIFSFCLLSFHQNERKIYKLRILSLSQFVYFSREMC